MAIVFRCEQCGRRYRVELDRAGTSANCVECGAALTVPNPESRTESTSSAVESDELSPAGTRIIRHEPRTVPTEIVGGDASTIDAVSDHITQYAGEIDFVYHELVSDLVHIDLHVVKATEERPWHLIVTSGMSEAPMNVPEGAEEFRFGELLIALPPEWPLDKQSFSNEANYWPIRLLKQMARLPHEYDTWLGFGHSVPNGDPAVPYHVSAPFTCALLLPPILMPPEFWTLSTPSGREIHFLAVVPLYQEEIEFKLEHGLDPLLDKFEEYHINEIIYRDRPNCCE
ncbi:MAG: suppressor of fused domain protein [Planctomycetaceae bacterium]